MMKVVLKFAASVLLLGCISDVVYSQFPVTKNDTCRIVFGWRASEASTPLLSWMKEGGYTWGVELLHDIPENRITEIKNNGFNIVLYQLAHPETVVRYYTQKKRAIPDVNATVEKYVRATGGKFVWQSILEDESCGVGLSQEFLKTEPKTHAQAYKMTNDYFRKSIEATHKFPELDLWSVAGFANTAHILAKQPEIKLLTIERANDDVDDLQTGISFFRGAAKQYGKKWGVDLSLWWGCVYGCIQEMPYLYHKRHLFLSWYSGAEHFRIEGSELFFNKATNMPNKITECLDNFGAFMKSHHRGEAIVPVAVIVPEDHGWITPPYWRTSNSVWNYARIPYRQGQKALDGFFSSAFPGSNFYMDPFALGKFKTENPPASPFALSYISQEFAPDSLDVFRAEYPVDFGMFTSRRDGGTEIVSKQIETSEFRPMGNSRWGDIIDVLTSDAGADVISDYKIIILLDQVKLDSKLINKLKLAMEKGSTVICPAGILKPEHSEFIGANIIPKLAVGSAWSYKGEKWQNEPFRYLPAKLTTGRAIASVPDSSPVVIEKDYGHGSLVSCMIPWFEGEPLPVSNLAVKIFDSAISKVQPARVEGLPIEFLSTETSDCFNVVLSNNSGTEWKGKVIAHLPDSKFNSCSELLTGQKFNSKYRKDKNGEVFISVPAYEVRVISWTGN